MSEEKPVVWCVVWRRDAYDAWEFEYYTGEWIAQKALRRVKREIKASTDLQDDDLADYAMLDKILMPTTLREFANTLDSHRRAW